MRSGWKWLEMPTCDRTSFSKGSALFSVSANAVGKCAAKNTPAAKVVQKVRSIDSPTASVAQAGLMQSRRSIIRLRELQWSASGLRDAAPEHVCTPPRARIANRFLVHATRSFCSRRLDSTCYSVLPVRARNACGIQGGKGTEGSPTSDNLANVTFQSYFDKAHSS